MPGTPETPLVVEESYRELLRVAVKAVGGQHRAAALVEVHQTTVGRALKSGHPVTYTTLRKFADNLPGLPDPVVSVRDADHERWCKLGAVLSEMKPEEFRTLLNFAERAVLDVTARLSDAEAAKVKAVVANVVPAKMARRMSRG